MKKKRSSSKDKHLVKIGRKQFKSKEQRVIEKDEGSSLSSSISSQLSKKAIYVTKRWASKDNHKR
jgi:hypothetical protein